MFFVRGFFGVGWDFVVEAVAFDGDASGFFDHAHHLLAREYLRFIPVFAILVGDFVLVNSNCDVICLRPMYTVGAGA